MHDWCRLFLTWLVSVSMVDQVLVVMPSCQVSVQMVSIQNFLEYEIVMAVVWICFRIVECKVTKD
jgi:hypothetical protein